MDQQKLFVVYGYPYAKSLKVYYLNHTLLAITNIDIENHSHDVK